MGGGFPTKRHRRLRLAVHHWQVAQGQRGGRTAGKMVSAERGSLHSGLSRSAAEAAVRRGQLLSVTLIAVSCVVTLAAGQLHERASGASMLLQTSKLDIAGKKDSYDGISSGLMGSLEKTMDASIDNEVSAFLSAPAIGAMPIPEVGSVSAKGGRGAFIPDAYKDEYAAKAETHSYLAKLGAEKRQLEREKAKLMDDLRARHKAAQMRATKASIAYNELHLQRAKEIAQMRQAQQAQQVARSMAKKMREATIAKQTAIHAQAVADARIHDLDAMVQQSNGYGQFIAKPAVSETHKLSSSRRASLPAATQTGAKARPKPASASRTVVSKGDNDAVRDATVNKGGVSLHDEDAKKGTKLYRYLEQQKQLEAKIKAAERAAKKHRLSAAKEAGKASHNSKVQTTFIRTIAKALYNNKQAIHKDEDAAANLKKKQEALFASMKALKHSDELLYEKIKSDPRS